MSTNCDVVGCAAPATGSYLHTARDTAVRFAICDEHLARLRDGVRPVVTEGRTGEPPALRVG